MQLSERFRYLGEGSAIAQGSRFALDDRQIMPPVVDRLPRQVMRPVYDPPVLAQDLPLGSDDDPFRVNPQTDRAIGEGRRHTVAIKLEVHEAGWRYPLGVFDKAVEGPS